MPGKVTVPRENAQSSGTRRRCLATLQTARSRAPLRGSSSSTSDSAESSESFSTSVSGFVSAFVSASASSSASDSESLPSTKPRAPHRIAGARTTADPTLYYNEHFPPIIKKMAGVGKRTYLRDVNPYLICPLCRGYLIDATTVVECLHSFCRSCILKHLNAEAHCPSCKHVLNKAKPNIKADKALQDIVYKLVPGLYHKEMRKRREFYKKHPEHADSATPEQRGEDVSGRLIFAPEDAVSLSLEYLPPGADPLTILSSTNDESTHSNTPNGSSISSNNQNIASSRRYLQCPALVAIAHLKKFLALKYGVDMTRYSIEICHRRAPLPEHWTLMDVAYIYAWKRNAPMRFFYRVTLEEQRLEAPPHERPSTPGLGASLPPSDAPVDAKANETNATPDPRDSPQHGEVPRLETETEIPKAERSPSTETKHPAEKIVDSVKKNSVEESHSTSAETTLVTTSPSTVVTACTSTTTTTTATNTVTTPVTATSPKQIKTPIKILKNPDGRYEVLRSPPDGWTPPKEPSSAPLTESKASGPEFSVVSIGNGQNSNGVKITLKQCSPSNISPNKPKVISNVLLHCGQMEKDTTGALMLQQLQREREKQQIDKQEKQKRRVTFMEAVTPEKPINNAPKSPVINKRPGEQEKKQFLQGFQLTAKESGPDTAVTNSTPKTNSLETSVTAETNDSSPKSSVQQKQEEGAPKTEPTTNVEDTKKKNTGENTVSSLPVSTVNSTSKRVGLVANVTMNKNAQVNVNKCNDSALSYSKSANTTVNASASNNATKMDVYTFSNDPPVPVPAGAVKRKCPPGLPIFDIKRRKQQQSQVPTPKKQTPASQNNTKSPRKQTTENFTPTKKPANVVADPGPSRILPPSNANATMNANVNVKPPIGPMLSNDTRNLLDGCGLNIPASLSITLTAPKSPGNNGGLVESNESKDNRKGTLGKVSPSITLNDRSVDPRVLKALKAGQIRMPAPAKPLRQTKQSDRETTPQRQTNPGKRKREQESRDILDLSGTKKMDIHPLRIPQPVAKLKPKPPTRDMPGISDQGQVVTLMGGHRYYRAPPGSLTPAAHRVSDCPIPSPTPTRTPVYAPGLSNSLGSPRSNTNLSSVFPSLQSLYALSQAPNLQQFQMDARLRLSRPNEGNISASGNSESRNTSNNTTPGKSHLAAQCAPVKPARSSVAPLAVPIAKQPSNDRSTSNTLNRPPFASETKLPPPFRGNDPLDTSNVGQQLSVQTKCSPTMEIPNRYSPRNTANSSTNCSSNDAHTSPAETVRDSNTEQSNEVRKEVEDSSRQQHHREAASPRVSSTASPSPPPGDATTSTHTEENNSNQSDNNITNTSNGNESDASAVSSEKSTTAAEVSSTNNKSPASPDSSSVAIESLASKSCSTGEQDLSSPTQTDTVRSTVVSTKLENPVSGDSQNEEEKNLPFKGANAKQLTSEMFQKRLLAAFPSNEWANNPIAAEHLGNFLKSLNASMKSDVNSKVENNSVEKLDSQAVCTDSTQVNNEASSKPQTDVAE